MGLSPKIQKPPPLLFSIWPYKEAKRAAKGESSHDYDMPIECRGVMAVSKAAELQRHHKKVRQQGRTIFAKSLQARHAHEIDPSMPSAAFSKLTSDMPRRHAAS
jgi:hypothetical protein